MLRTVLQPFDGSQRRDRRVFRQDQKALRGSWWCYVNRAYRHQIASKVHSRPSNSKVLWLQSETRLTPSLSESVNRTSAAPSRRYKAGLTRHAPASVDAEYVHVSTLLSNRTGIG